MAKIYTPQEAARLSDKEVRKAYSQLRSVARKRADRLEAAGFSVKRFPSVKEMALDTDEIRAQLNEVSYYLRSPQSKLSIVKHEKELSSLLASGYDIQDQKQFGQFMEFFRAKYHGRVVPPSDLPASIYNDAEKKGISSKTLQREFGKYLNDVDKMKELRNAINVSRVSDRYGRVTAKQLKSMLR